MSIFVYTVKVNVSPVSERDNYPLLERKQWQLIVSHSLFIDTWKYSIEKCCFLSYF